MQITERSGSSDEYRYGFNGKEKDDELKGEGNSINYEARMQDTRVGRFLSIDPLTKSFPHYSPYQFAGNTPIQAIDLDGAEEYHYLAMWDKKTERIVFKIENDRTVMKKSFLGFEWTPKPQHTVVYQGSDGDKTTFVFTASYIARMGAKFVIVNRVSELKNFVKEAKINSYKSEEDAENALNSTFMSEGAKAINDLGGAMVDYSTSRDAFLTKLPVKEKAPQISTKIDIGKQGKHIVNNNNYKTQVANGKSPSILEANPQNLLDNFQNGKVNSSTIINADKTRVDFGVEIGKYYNTKTGNYEKTTNGIIHNSKSGHILYLLHQVHQIKIT